MIWTHHKSTPEEQNNYSLKLIYSQSVIISLSMFLLKKSESLLLPGLAKSLVLKKQNMF